MDSPPESALIIPIPLPSALEALRLQHVPNARLGVPAHVTLLYPFATPAAIDTATVARARAAVATLPAFEAEFREVQAWEPGVDHLGVVWLAPEPVARFRELIAALAAAFPEHPPYGGAFDEVIPHLTVAEASDGLAEIASEARRWVPFGRRVVAARLIVENAEGRWRSHRRLPLA